MHVMYVVNISMGMLHKEVFNVISKLGVLNDILSYICLLFHMRCIVQFEHQLLTRSDTYSLPSDGVFLLSVVCSLR